MRSRRGEAELRASRQGVTISFHSEGNRAPNLERMGHPLLKVLTRNIMILSSFTQAFYRAFPPLFCSLYVLYVPVLFNCTTKVFFAIVLMRSPLRSSFAAIC